MWSCFPFGRPDAPSKFDIDAALSKVSPHFRVDKTQRWVATMNMAWHKAAVVWVHTLQVRQAGSREHYSGVCAEKVRSLATFMYCEVVSQGCGDEGQNLAVVPCMPFEFGLSTDLILPCYDTVHQQGVIVPVQKLPLTWYLRKSEDGQCPFYAVVGQRIVNS